MLAECPKGLLAKLAVLRGAVTGIPRPAPNAARAPAALGYALGAVLGVSRAVLGDSHARRGEVRRSPRAHWSSRFSACSALSARAARLRSRNASSRWRT